jgi:hypothetical protein
MSSMKVNMLSGILHATRGLPNAFYKHLERVAPKLSGDNVYETATTVAVHILMQILTWSEFWVNLNHIIRKGLCYEPQRYGLADAHGQNILHFGVNTH